MLKTVNIHSTTNENYGQSSNHYKHFNLILTEYAKDSLLVLADDVNSPFVGKQIQIQPMHQANLVPWIIKIWQGYKMISPKAYGIHINKHIQKKVYLLELMNQEFQNILWEH